MGKNCLWCILMALQYFKLNEIYISDGSIQIKNVLVLKTAKFASGLNVKQDYLNTSHLAFVSAIKTAVFDCFQFS